MIVNWTINKNVQLYLINYLNHCEFIYCDNVSRGLRHIKLIMIAKILCYKNETNELFKCNLQYIGKVLNVYIINLVIFI